MHIIICFSVEHKDQQTLENDRENEKTVIAIKKYLHPLSTLTVDFIGA